MRLIVFSDSHGKTAGMTEVIARNRNADCFLHLGDGADEFTALCTAEGVVGIAVSGNCDFSYCSPYGKFPDELLTEFGNIRVFMTHGHKYHVKWDTASLIRAAREKGADIALYGHTHTAECTYIPPDADGVKPLYLINPGSISRPSDGITPSFASIEIRNGMILPSVARLD